MPYSRRDSWSTPAVVNALLVCGLMLLAGSPLLAQTGGQGGTGGQTGGGTTGGGLGGGGLGQAGTGGLGGGLQGPELLQFGAEIDATGGTGFAGRGNASENFVGGLVQPQAQAGFGAGGRGNSMFSAINRQGGQFNRVPQPTGPSRSERVRPQHRIAFEFSPRQAESVTTNLRTRLGALESRVNGVDVLLDERGTATLRGNVVDERSAKLAAALARLEPGVRAVNSELIIAGAEQPQP